MKTFCTLLLLCGLYLSGFSAQQKELPCWRRQGDATQLIVDGKPMLLLGGELGNSTASSPEKLERIFPRLKRMGLNTVLVPAYWDLIEPEEGQFDFSLVDKAIGEARANGLKIVFLWFGAWKNSMSCYAPLWFKADTKKYPRCYTKEGKVLEIASPFSENVFQADCKAFKELMAHIAATDGEEQTVIMIQVENEIGMVESARDYSDVANKFFHAEIPKDLSVFLKKDSKQLHPWLAEKWKKSGGKTEGTWQEVFGDDLFTEEIFMAWHYASYVERMIQAGRSVYALPMYVNAAMNSRNRIPGEYPSAGPLAHLKDIWHCAAPSIDLLAPDLYDEGFTDWVEQYHLPDNPLFIPEIRLEDNDGVRACYVFGEHDGIGFSPFSIEDAPDNPDSPLAQSYRMLGELTPYIIRHQGSNDIRGVIFSGKEEETVLQWGETDLVCRHFFTLPWDKRATDGSVWPEGGGIIIRLAEDEFLIAGCGIVVEFKHRDETGMEKQQSLGEDGFALKGENAGSQSAADWKTKKRLGLGYVDEVSIAPDGTMKRISRMNGDQSHQGRHARIGVDNFCILHVKLYTYK